MQPQPIGVPGELYLGGAGLARGYLHRPGLTAERFVADPFGEAPGARLYRSGDLARWLPDGNLELLGRIDHQVKIRGYRVELGEIEAALSSLDSVREAVVVAREDEGQARRLVAYVVSRSDAPKVDRLRSALAKRLPSHMVPSAFVFLEALPLTPNGKLDRKALPAPGGERPDLGGAYVPPRNATEELLAEIMRDVLGVDRVGVHDNFFALGGDSILGIQVVSRIRAQGFEISPLELFQNQAVAALATVLREAPGVEAEQGEVTGPVKLTPIQHWFTVGGSGGTRPRGLPRGRGRLSDGRLVHLHLSGIVAQGRVGWPRGPSQVGQGAATQRAPAGARVRSAALWWSGGDPGGAGARPPGRGFLHLPGSVGPGAGRA
jgi:aryl carrier-like protein